MGRIGAEIDLVMALRNIESLGQFPGTRTKPPEIFDSAPFPHQNQAAARLKRANQDEPITRPAFDEHVQHPVHAIIEVDITGAGLVSPNELARARAAEGVAGFVALHQVSLRLDHDPGASSPHEFGPDEVLGALQGVDREK